MPAVTRLSDLGSGHPVGFPTHPAISPDLNNVYIDNLPIVCVGNTYAVHSNGTSSHSGVLATGSPTVFVNNIAVGRIGDAISCGGVVLTGSPDVFVDGD